VSGFFKANWKGDGFEFKVGSINLLETVKQNLTKNIDLSVTPGSVSKEFVDFVENNVRRHPGKSALRFNIHEPLENLKVSLYHTDKGFTMNEEMADFLIAHPDVDVTVGLVER
jgi:DNA polymerase-3 subunit alpha